MKDGFTENVYQAIGEKKEYPEWALGLAALLAMSSLFPIMVGLAIHLINICSLSSKQIPPTTNKLFRVDTSASTRPMMEENMEVFVIPSIYCLRLNKISSILTEICLSYYFL